MWHRFVTALPGNGLTNSTPYSSSISAHMTSYHLDRHIQELLAGCAHDACRQGQTGGYPYGEACSTSLITTEKFFFRGHHTTERNAMLKGCTSA